MVSYKKNGEKWRNLMIDAPKDLQSRHFVKAGITRVAADNKTVNQA